LGTVIINSFKKRGILMLSYHSTADEINDSGIDTVILPIGSIEQHGPHLPIETDCIIPLEIAKEIAEKIGAFLLPVLPISTCIEHMGKKGSVWMNPDTFYHMLTDILLSLKEQGFKRIIIFQGHGGIFVLGPIVRQINATNPDIKVIKVDFLNYLNTDEMLDTLESRDNLHACEYETSLMLFLNEELVRKDKIIDCVPDVPRDYLNYGSIFKYSKNGVWGRPSLATKEKGKRIFQILVDKSIQYIDQVTDI